MHRNKRKSAIAILIAGAILFTACSPSSPKTPTINPEDLLTQAAGTVAVELTKNAALTPAPLPATATPEPTIALPPTQQPAAQPTQPPAAPTNTTAPTTASASTGDAGSFVEDVTIPDGTGAAPGIQFDKIWRVKNTGTTTWTQAYALVYIDGEKMGAPDSIAMPKDVQPGETVDITVKLTAPDKTGTHQTFFRLRNANGQFFRLDGGGDLWVKISVGGSSPTPNLTATSQTYTATPSSTPSP